MSHSKPGLTLDITYRRIAELKPDPANPRHHTKKQIRQIADSIKTFGFNVPILVDRDGKIIAGHGRYDAAHLIGMTEVPARGLTPSAITRWATASRPATPGSEKAGRRNRRTSPPS